MTFEFQLIKLSIVKGAEFWRQATKGPDKPELRSDDVNDQTKPSLLSKLEAILGFTLHLHERISRRQKVRVQVGAAVRRKSEIADLVRDLESPAYQVTASPNMFRPAEATESKSGLVVAKVRSGDQAKGHIGGARTVAVALLEAEINRPTDGQGEKIRVRKQCRRKDLGQNIHGREGGRVAHQGQLNELLDRATSEL